MITSFQWANDDNLVKSAEQERHARYQRAMANLPESERGENPVQTVESQFYTPSQDVTETLRDGRCFIVCAAGMPMPIAEARRRGLVVEAKERQGQRNDLTSVNFLTEVSAVPESAEPSTDDTPSDKRQAVLTALAQHPEWSDREIARQTGASNTYVGRLRKAGA